MAAYQLAQVNIARGRAPIDAPQMADFVALLDPVNAIADAAPGFVWRLQTDDGNATSLHVFGDEGLLVNMSVWKDIDSLRAFVYQTRHLEVFQRRREWFEKMDEAYLALWWIPAGSIPTVPEAEQRVTYIREHGPTARAFTLKTPFPPPVEVEVPGS